MKKHRRFLTLLCFVSLGSLFLSCRKTRQEDVSLEGAAPAVQAGVTGTKLETLNVSLPLQATVGEDKILLHGRAKLARLRLGAGKRGGGLMTLLSPALRVDGADVETDGNDLSILSDLPAAIHSLVKVDALEFSNLRVRGKSGDTLLECGSASVAGDGAWELREVRLAGGPWVPRLHMVFDANGTPRITGGR